MTRSRREALTWVLIAFATLALAMQAATESPTALALVALLVPINGYLVWRWYNTPPMRAPDRRVLEGDVRWLIGIRKEHESTTKETP